MDKRRRENQRDQNMRVEHTCVEAAESMGVPRLFPLVVACHDVVEILFETLSNTSSVSSCVHLLA